MRNLAVQGREEERTGAEGEGADIYLPRVMLNRHT